LRSLSFQSLLLTRDQAFNHNIYRNYHFGVRWTLSPKDLCELGFQNEKSFGTEYEVYLANHSKAYQATLELERDQLATSLEYHKEQLSRWQDVQASPTREKRGFYSTEFRVLDQPSFYLLITSKRDESYLKLLFWSQRELNSRSLAEEIRWDSRGPYQISSNYFTSDRLGFSLRKRDEDKVRVITPRELEPVGDVLEVQGQQGKQFLYCINSHFMDEELLLDLFLSSQPSTMSLQFLGSTSSDLLGLKILERKFSYRWGDKPKRLIQKTLRRGSTVFSVFTHRSPDETFVNLLHSLENRPWDSWKLSF